MHQHQCTECGAVAAEPRLRYCEECGARMPEFKPPPLIDESAQKAAALENSRRAQPAYTGPKWLEHVPAHSPTVLGVLLHMVALFLSILPFLAGVGPFWSAVVIAGGALMIAREYRAANETNPLLDWIPESLQPRVLPVVYSGLAVAIALPMLELSIQPLLWAGGTVLVLRDQWGKVFEGPDGYADLFEPRAAVRGMRVLATAGIAVCLLALFFTWTVAGEVANGQSVYGGAGGLAVSGFELSMSSTVEIGLMAILALLMLRPEVERPVWLRFVPAGVMVIALVWVLVNMHMKVGPIVFLAGLVPVGLVAVFQALGRDEAAPAGEAPFDEDTNAESQEEFADEEPPPEDEDMRG
ncbi:hypothetical protein [Hyalangium versicolor]|uniref:hypothetical protein n=1 Tax=Hyalangium versicolor TaxID=2861190 RepID=UPI001CCFA234|nr:hypothetical protein [Hyalangium versicolor]